MARLGRGPAGRWPVSAGVLAIRRALGCEPWLVLTLVAIGFLAGLVTALSPCVLPVLPGILAGSSLTAQPGTATQAGPSTPGAVAAPARTSRRRGFTIVAGLLTSFTLLTLLGATLVSALRVPEGFLRGLALVMILVVGLGLLVPGIVRAVRRSGAGGDHRPGGLTGPERGVGGPHAGVRGRPVHPPAADRLARSGDRSAAGGADADGAARRRRRADHHCRGDGARAHRCGPARRPGLRGRRAAPGRGQPDGPRGTRCAALRRTGRAGRSHGTSDVQRM